LPAVIADPVFIAVDRRAESALKALKSAEDSPRILRVRDNSFAMP
jgi:hypothetical protein